MVRRGCIWGWLVGVLALLVVFLVTVVTIEALLGQQVSFPAYGDRVGLVRVEGLLVDSRDVVRDLRAMGELVGAADNGVSLARSAYFPQIVAVGTYAWDRPNREYDPRFYEHWSVTVAAQMNVFDWGGTQNRVKEARAGLAEVTRAMDLTEDAVRLEVKQSFLAYQEATEALPIAEDALAQAREGLRVAEVSFENGIATESTVLDAQASLTTAEMNRIAALAGLRLAEAGLEFAAGVAGR